MGILWFLRLRVESTQVVIFRVGHRVELKSSWSSSRVDESTRSTLGHGHWKSSNFHPHLVPKYILLLLSKIHCKIVLLIITSITKAFIIPHRC